MKKLSLIFALFIMAPTSWATPECNEDLLPSRQAVIERIEMIAQEGNLNSANSSLMLDEFIGFNIRSVEELVQESHPEDSFDRHVVETHLGKAKWSASNIHYGWSTSYGYLYSLYKEINLRPGGRVVDIGSGYGRPGISLGFLYPDSEYIGYEIVPQRVRSAQKIAEDYGLSNVRFIEQDLSAPNFKIAPADYYYMYDPVNDETLEFLIERMFEANGDNHFKIILQPGGGGKYLDILKARFPHNTQLRFGFGHAYIFDSKEIQ